MYTRYQARTFESLLSTKATCIRGTSDKLLGRETCAVCRQDQAEKVILLHYCRRTTSPGRLNFGRPLCSLLSQVSHLLWSPLSKVPHLLCSLLSKVPNVLWSVLSKRPEEAAEIQSTVLVASWSGCVRAESMTTGTDLVKHHNQCSHDWDASWVLLTC